MIQKLKVHIGEINSLITDDKGNPVACTYSGYFGKEEADKLATLFATAPELLEALKELIRVGKDSTKDLIGWDGAASFDNAIDKAELSIKKATTLNNQ